MNIIKKSISLCMIVLMVVGFSGFVVDDSEGKTVTLYAGQDIEVGYVKITNDAENVYVSFVITEDDWAIYETNVAVEQAVGTIPTNKKGNPVVGHFEYSSEHSGIEQYTVTAPLSELQGDIVVAAHAVVENIKVDVLADGPYEGSDIVDYAQGTGMNSGMQFPVEDVRSDPSLALSFDASGQEGTFYSLGFCCTSVSEAFVTIEFEYPITNGSGDDVRIVETTWGGTGSTWLYPLEEAEVYASNNGVDWQLLGVANNRERFDSSNYLTYAEFDLSDVGMDEARYIKVVDVSDISLFRYVGDVADGYDLEAVQSIHDYEEKTVISETAWADGEKILTKGNWATYVDYTIE